MLDVAFDVVHFYKNIMSSSNHCILSYINVGTTTRGNFQICCHGVGEKKLVNNNNQLLTVKDDISFDDILMADSSVKIRQTLDSGEWPEHCSRCRTVEEAGLISPRIVANRRYANQSYVVDLPKPIVTFLELRWSNLCNLSCISCGPERSSSIEKKITFHTGKIFPQPHIPNEAFYIKAVESLPTLNMLKFSGGEPLLIRNTQRLIREAVTKGYASKIELEFNTNVTVFPKWLEELLPQFRAVTFELSIDGLGDHFEYIRNPASWSKVSNNINKFFYLQKCYPTIKLIIAPTISIFNILHLPDFLNWAHTLGAELKGNILYRPQLMNLQSLPASVKETVKSTIIQKSKDYNLNLTAQKLIQESINYMSASTSKVSSNDLLNWISKTDINQKKIFLSIEPNMIEMLQANL